MNLVENSSEMQGGLMLQISHRLGSLSSFAGQMQVL